MSALVRLYPKAWRERYETEFRSLLEARPPGPGDRIDIVRGAIDARVHRELPGDPTRTPTRRVPIAAAVALVAGASWLAWSALILLEFRGWDAGQPEHASLGLVLALAAGLSLAAAHVAVGLAGTSTMRPAGGPAAALAAVTFGATAFGGSLAFLVALLASVVLAWALAGRTIPTALSVVWSATAMAVIGAMWLFVAGNGVDVGLLVWLVPFGLCWLLIGGYLLVRGVPSAAGDPTVGAEGPA